MDFITLSKKDVVSPSGYKTIRTPHILISITGSEETDKVVPVNPNCQGSLALTFDDIEDIENNYIYFDKGMARDIFELVNSYCKGVHLIVVQSRLGLSRSIAVASAISKIINGVDDKVFTRGIPNMFVYTTILETFFSNPNWVKDYPGIYTIRSAELSKFLTPVLVRMSSVRNKKKNI